MRDWLMLTAVALIVTGINIAVFDVKDTVYIVCIWVFVSVAMALLARAGAAYRKAMREETRLHQRVRPVGVTVDFEGVMHPVPCEVIADPEGETDEAGRPLRWIARPHHVPEGGGGIVSYHVAKWPPRHGIVLNIEGLDL